MNIDAEAIMAEYNQTVINLAQRAATLSGMLSAANKALAEAQARTAELEAQAKKPAKPPKE